MSTPVWVLSVDLQTKTATFQSGMADAARAARGSFNDIKQGAGDMARDTGTNMMEARHGVMLLSEEFGIHLPRALTTFVAGLGPVGEAMEAAFPFLAILVGATLLIQHLSKLHEEAEKLTEAQSQFGVVAANVLNDLDEKLLQAGIRTDELNENHLGALTKQLQLIDRQSLKDLEHSFEELGKAADAVMAELKTHWYQFGAGSDGAKHALSEFQRQYDMLLAQGKDKEASDLLAGTLQSAQRILALQKQAKDNQLDNRRDQGAAGDAEAYKKFVEANVALSAAGTDHSEKAIQAQQTLVDALNAQVSAQTKIAELKKVQGSNETQNTQKTIDGDADKAAQQRADAFKKEVDWKDKLDEQAYNDAVNRIQQGEKEKLAATDQGSAERLAAIDAAIKEENAKGLQDTGFYKELLTQRVQTARQMATEEAQADAEGKTEAAAHSLKMDELKVQSDKEAAQLRLSTAHNAAQEMLASELQSAEEEFKAKAKANEADIAALNQHGKDYENKLKALQDRQKELVQAHENEITAIKDKAEEQRNARILAADRRFQDTISQQLTATLMRHQTFGRMMDSIGDQVATGMMQNAVKSVLADDFTKERDAAAAARKAFLAGMQFPFPANVILGPTLAAAAFASVMAFDAGGLVPGTTNFDSVPAMLKPGEAVIPKEMTERLRRASGDDANAGQHVHVHHHSSYTVHAIDGASVESMLNKHADKFHKHVESQIRRMNR